MSSRCSPKLEQLEARFALAGSASGDDIDLYQRTANSLRRLLEAVGLQRRPREIEPIDQYLTRQRAYRRVVNLTGRRGGKDRFLSRVSQSGAPRCAAIGASIFLPASRRSYFC